MQIIPVAVAGLVKNNKVLLIKRAHEPFKGHWCLPGGKIEYGEHAADAVLRELKEETGIDARFVAMKGIISEIIHGKQDHHFLLMLCALDADDLEATPSSEGDVQWFDLDSLDNHKIVPSDIKFIHEMLLQQKPLTFNTSIIHFDGENYHLEEFS